LQSNFLPFIICGCDFKINGIISSFSKVIKPNPL